MKIFFIPTCPKHKNRLEAMKKTWIPKEDSSSFKIFYVYSNPNNTKEEVRGRNLILPHEELYQNLFLKTHGSFRFFSEAFPKAECVVKMDDDVNIECFSTVLEQIDKMLEHNVN